MVMEMSDTKINDGGPAFPCDVQIEDNNGSHYEERYGMSLRDWFAGHALAGICANTKLTGDDGGFSSANLNVAFQIADMMLAARNAK